MPLEITWYTGWDGRLTARWCDSELRMKQLRDSSSALDAEIAYKVKGAKNPPRNTRITAAQPASEARVRRTG